MRSINDNFKRKKELNKELAKLNIEYKNKKEKLESAIKEQEEYIEQFSKLDDSVAIGKQLCSVQTMASDYKLAERIKTLGFAISLIKDGQLDNMFKQNERISYWYNSGFRSGHPRTIKKGYGENYATEKVRISFANELYGSDYELNTQDTLAILAYLRHELKLSEA